MCNDSRKNIDKFILISLKKNKPNIIKKCENLLRENPKEKEVYCSMYNMTININYELLIENLNKQFKKTII